MNNAIRRDVALIAAIVLFVVGIFSAVTAWKPELFGFFVGIIGGTGALLVLYEVHHTKRIAQATFLRDLNTAFASDNAISDLWRKLLLEETLEKSDRPLISSYLTFFETIYLLLDRKVVDLRLVDNLFRNRFFTAVGHPQIQSMALLSQADSFHNIHALVRTWSEFLLKEGTRQHHGYYSYLRGSLEQRGLHIVQLTSGHVDSLLSLQEEVTLQISDTDWLRNNGRDSWTDCVENHFTLGIFDAHEVLIAAAVLFDAGEGSENIAKYLTTKVTATSSLNLKVVLVSPKAQRSGLARVLVQLLEHHAISIGRDEILCTIHRANRPSASLFESLGYKKSGQAATTYGPRNIYGKQLVLRRSRPAR